MNTSNNDKVIELSGEKVSHINKLTSEFADISILGELIKVSSMSFKEILRAMKALKCEIPALILADRKELHD